MSAVEGFELVRRYATDGGDDYEAARRLLTDLRVSQKAAAALVPVIAWAVATMRRQHDRVEQAPLRASRRKGLGFTHNTIEARKRALDTIMRFGDGRRIRLGAASVDDHREYIGMLERNVSGLRDTIVFHESLIAQIEAAGVACLDEIEMGAAA